MDNREEYFTQLWDNIERIKNGELWFDEIVIPDEKVPVSWTSKICHIINPQEYPYIWDSNNQKNLQFHDRNTWKARCDEARKEAKTDEEIYEMDSRVWASQG